ncbi:hypothetical protein O6H91_09G065200 [Diphasiastrum complanatum]|uniref:Uncharacterized protein n=1 Tax=Diphasiastrum complanatum TaxID=34168 RepID=A0ACC2CQ76_DIPCM|nr:hypothetical protein O6H91_09G065200 [Diphasiastrum complanatum]
MDKLDRGVVFTQAWGPWLHSPAASPNAWNKCVSACANFCHGIVSSRTLSALSVFFLNLIFDLPVFFLNRIFDLCRIQLLRLIDGLCCLIHPKFSNPLSIANVSGFMFLI